MSPARTAETQIVTYIAPPEIAPSPDYRLRLDGQDVFVYATPQGSYAIASLDGPARVEIETTFDFACVVVRPLKRAISTLALGRSVAFDLLGPALLSVEFDDDLRRPLFLWLSEPERDAPEPGDPGVIYFEGGRVHRPGEIELRSGQTLYIAGGAVVHGHVVAQDAEHIAVRGRGVLDGSESVLPAPGKKKTRLILPRNCRDVTVEGIAAVGNPSWTFVPIACQGVRVRDFKILTWICTGDGVDVAGSSDVTVEDSFFCTNDDCVAIKAVDYNSPEGCRNVEHVRVERCVLWNEKCGNALEIGYETRCDTMRDIVFRDCDVIHCEREGYQSGAVFSIHNGDRATISDVLFEDIRVEDAREKLIDLKVLVARYSKDDRRGYIRDITFRDIRVVGGPAPVSIIRGHEPEHLIQNVTIENLTIHGQVAKDALEARMVVELATGVRFVHEEAR
jgi:hypothetical protein